MTSLMSFLERSGFFAALLDTMPLSKVLASHAVDELKPSKFIALATGWTKKL